MRLNVFLQEKPCKFDMQFLISVNLTMRKWTVSLTRDPSTDKDYVEIDFDTSDLTSYLQFRQKYELGNI